MLRYHPISGQHLGSLHGLDYRLLQVLEMSPAHQSVWAGTADGKLIMCRYFDEYGQRPCLGEAECYTGHPDEIKGARTSTPPPTHDSLWFP